jgi:hypothetical protein
MSDDHPKLLVSGLDVVAAIVHAAGGEVHVPAAHFQIAAGRRLMLSETFDRDTGCYVFKSLRPVSFFAGRPLELQASRRYLPAPQPDGENDAKESRDPTAPQTDRD